MSKRNQTELFQQTSFRRNSIHIRPHTFWLSSWKSRFADFRRVVFLCTRFRSIHQTNQSIWKKDSIIDMNFMTCFLITANDYKIIFNLKWFVWHWFCWSHSFRYEVMRTRTIHAIFESWDLISRQSSCDVRSTSSRWQCRTYIRYRMWNQVLRLENSVDRSCEKD